ncbi:MAG: hypothetical protein Kow0098_21010 [Ignavibacteriaceae bacterium]
MLLSLGAILLLSMLTLRVNTNQLTTEETMVNSKMGLMAISLANSYIEEANKLAFDEATVDEFVDNIGPLTGTGNLGPAVGEYYPDFNDFDDFNDFFTIDTVQIGTVEELFQISCTVHYIQPENPDQISLKKTYHKRINVTVSHPSMTDAITISSIFSYWKEI